MLCDQLSRHPDLRGIIRDSGAGGDLDQLLAALGGRDEPDPERMLAWMHAIDDACARMGLTGITSRDKAYNFLPAGLSGPSVSQAWVCPRGRCDRVVLPEETQAPPTCAASGETPMRPFSLPPS